MDCPFCGTAVGQSTHPNLVCDECDERAVGNAGDEPWDGWPDGEAPESDDGTVRLPPDDGENPVFIDGEKCWRRYRFGGWVTMKDEHDCETLEEFYDAHDLV